MKKPLTKKLQGIVTYYDAKSYWRSTAKVTEMNKVPSEATWRQIRALIPVYMNVFMMGSAIGWLSNAVYFFLEGKEVHASSSQCALIASCSELGRIVFALPSGILADKYGRKKIILSVAFLHFFAWIGLTLNTSLITIYTGRFILGLATALVNSTALISIGEIASSEIRGQLTGIYQIFLCTGVILPSAINAIFSTYKSLAWGITFFAFLSLVSMFLVMETPSFLISASKHQQAEQNLKFIRQGYQENDINYEFENLKKYIEEEKIRKSQLTWLTFLKSAAIRKPLITGILLNFFSIATGGAIISVYITAIYPSNEFISKKYYPLITQVSLLFVSISTTFYIEKFPRRNIFMFGAAILIVTNAFCALVDYLVNQNQNESFFKWMFSLGNAFSLLCFTASVQPMNSAIKSELFPQAVKGFCASLVTISQALGTIFSLQLYNLVKEYSSLYTMYVILSINSLILYLVIYFCLPEGRGAHLADLQMKFKEEPVFSNRSDREKRNC